MRRLRVVSWNVGRIYSPTDNNKLEDRALPHVARVLHELDGDVVLLQELVSARQAEALVRALDAADVGAEAGWAGRMSVACRYDRHVAVLARRRLQPVFEDSALEPTGRGLVTVRVDVGGQAAALSSLHLDAFRAHGRRSQVEALLALDGARAEPLVVVGGDLNLDPDWAARAGAEVDRGTFALLDGRFRGPRPVGATLMGMFRVDHLMARGHLAGKLRQHVSPRRRVPVGDHDPIILDVELDRSSMIDGKGANH